MGQVLYVASRNAVDDAWECYRAHVARSFEDRHLILDREYMTEWGRLHGRFMKLAMMVDREA